MVALDTWVITEENTVWIDDESLIWIDDFDATGALETLVTKQRDHQIQTKKRERVHKVRGKIRCISMNPQ